MNAELETECRREPLMNPYKIAVLTDSGCDVPQNFREKYNIFMLPLRVMYPEKDYDDGVNIDPMMVYRRFPVAFAGGGPGYV